MSFVMSSSSLKAPQELLFRQLQDAAAPAPAPAPTPHVPLDADPALNFTIPAPPALKPQIDPAPLWPIPPTPESEVGMADRFNTPIPSDQQAAYDAWAKQQSEALGRDVNKDKLDYDVQGFYLSGQGLGANAHGPDTPSAAVPSQGALFSYGAEVRKDKDGNPAVYHPPKNDRGVEEIAGFTAADNPKELALLKSTPPDQRKDVILGLMDKATAPALNWSADPGVQGLLRDMAFHRGVGGAQAMIGMALGEPAVETAQVTPEQIAALSALPRPQAIAALTAARHEYEEKIMGHRKNLSEGLDNRFNQAAKTFLNIDQNGA